MTLWNTVDNPASTSNPQTPAPTIDTCPTCNYPLTWSLNQGRVWCSVFGDHPNPTPSLLMLRADLENAAFRIGPRRRYQLRRVA